MKRNFFIGLSALLMCACSQPKTLEVSVANPYDNDRENECIELCYDALQEALGVKADQPLVVLDAEGNEVCSQILYHACHCLRIVFQASVKAGDTAVYTIAPGERSEFPVKAQTTFMPRRKDDISWENDCAIYRMYGPALVTDPDEGMVSGGIDVWVKRTREMVSQKWYQDEFDGKSSYHNDNGEGLDFYSVGTTLGAGAMAPFIDGKLCYVGNNFVKYDILENGPIRTVFRLEYEAYDVNGQAVSETRTVTLNAGSYLNQFVIRYDSLLAEGTTLAAGFPFRGFTEPCKTKVDKRGLADCQDIVACQKNGFVAYAEPAVEGKGVIYLASILPTEASEQLISNNHILNCTTYEGKPVVYYAGGAWNQDIFPTLKDWTDYVAAYAFRVRNPLSVEISMCEKDNCCEK